MAPSKKVMMGVVMCVLLVLALGENRSSYPHCKSECYLECMHMRLFTWNECKIICDQACEIAPSPVADDEFNPKEGGVSPNSEEIGSIHAQLEWLQKPSTRASMFSSPLIFNMWQIRITFVVSLKRRFRKWLKPFYSSWSSYSVNWTKLFQTVKWIMLERN